MTCNLHSKKGHLEKACIIKKKTLQNIVELPSDDDDSAQTYDTDAVHIKDASREVIANVTFCTKQAYQIQGKVDTSAMATCMSYSMLKQIKVNNKDLTPSKAKLWGITGTMMKTIGELKVEASCNNLTKTAKVIVTNPGSELILGVDFAEHFRWWQQPAVVSKDMWTLWK